MTRRIKMAVVGPGSFLMGSSPNFTHQGREERLTCHDGHIFTAPVGSYKPNAFGLYDMEGNAFEWVEDCWADNYQGAPSDGSARVTNADCSNRVNRGGSWTSNPTGLRSGHRGVDNFESTRVVDLGFRVARPI